MVSSYTGIPIRVKCNSMVTRHISTGIFTCQENIFLIIGAIMDCNYFEWYRLALGRTFIYVVSLDTENRI